MSIGKIRPPAGRIKSPPAGEPPRAPKLVVMKLVSLDAKGDEIQSPPPRWGVFSDTVPLTFHADFATFSEADTRALELTREFSYQLLP
jgi:hypothetical protein